MVTNRTCAVVVTFHPDPDILENLSKLRGQVEGLVVVDNGSPAAATSLLRSASSKLGFQLVENGENLGIATALNIGIDWAESHSYQWVIFFDQDSAVTEGFIDTMLHVFVNSPRGDRLAIVVPHYVDKRSGTDLLTVSVRNGGLETAMTSGTLMRVSSFQQLGKFEDDLFIDAVDYEFSLRLRSNGYFIEECNQAVLLHAPGTPKVHKLWGMYLFQTANYSPVRRYYQERNKVWVARRYWRRFPFFCIKLFAFSLKDCAKGILAESQKWDKFHHASVGIADGLRGRMGRFNGI